MTESLGPRPGVPERTIATGPTPLKPSHSTAAKTTAVAAKALSSAPSTPKPPINNAPTRLRSVVTANVGGEKRLFSVGIRQNGVKRPLIAGDARNQYLQTLQDSIPAFKAHAEADYCRQNNLNPEDIVLHPLTFTFDKNDEGKWKLIGFAFQIFEKREVNSDGQVSLHLIGTSSFQRPDIAALANNPELAKPLENLNQAYESYKDAEKTHRSTLREVSYVNNHNQWVNQFANAAQNLYGNEITRLPESKPQLLVKHLQIIAKLNKNSYVKDPQGTIQAITKAIDQIPSRDKKAFLVALLFNGQMKGSRTTLIHSHINMMTLQALLEHKDLKGDTKNIEELLGWVKDGIINLDRSDERLARLNFSTLDNLQRTYSQSEIQDHIIEKTEEGYYPSKLIFRPSAHAHFVSSFRSSDRQANYRLTHLSHTRPNPKTGQRETLQYLFANNRWYCMTTQNLEPKAVDPKEVTTALNSGDAIATYQKELSPLGDNLQALNQLHYENDLFELHDGYSVPDRVVIDLLTRRLSHLPPHQVQVSVEQNRDGRLRCYQLSDDPGKSGDAGWISEAITNFKNAHDLSLRNKNISAPEKLLIPLRYQERIVYMIIEKKQSRDFIASYIDPLSLKPEGDGKTPTKLQKILNQFVQPSGVKSMSALIASNQKKWDKLDESNDHDFPTPGWSSLTGLTLAVEGLTDPKGLALAARRFQNVDHMTEGFEEVSKGLNIYNHFSPNCGFNRGATFERHLSINYESAQQQRLMKEAHGELKGLMALINNGELSITTAHKLAAYLDGRIHENQLLQPQSQLDYLVNFNLQVNGPEKNVAAQIQKMYLAHQAAETTKGTPFTCTLVINNQPHFAYIKPPAGPQDRVSVQCFNIPDNPEIEGQVKAVFHVAFNGIQIVDPEIRPNSVKYAGIEADPDLSLEALNWLKLATLATYVNDYNHQYTLDMVEAMIANKLGLPNALRAHLPLNIAEVRATPPSLPARGPETTVLSDRALDAAAAPLRSDTGHRSGTYAAPPPGGFQHLPGKDAPPLDFPENLPF